MLKKVKLNRNKARRLHLASFIFVSFARCLLKTKVIMKHLGGVALIFLLVVTIIESAPAIGDVQVESEYNNVSDDSYEFS